jgi:hypothetical protein
LNGYMVCAQHQRLGNERAAESWLR